MELSATLTETELRQLAAGLVPLRIDLSTDDDSPRWLDVVELVDTELVPDEGFVVAAKAQVSWPERRLLDSFTVPKVAMLVEPTLEATHEGVGLIIKVRCRDIDLRWVPDFVDQRIVGAINERLRKAGVEFRWNLSETLSVEFPQTGSQTNIESIGLDISEASLEVDGHRVTIEGPMEVRVVQAPPRDLAASEQPALPEAGIA